MTKYRKSETVIVDDKMQKGYWCELVEEAGKNFDPRFKPELTPKQMLALGCVTVLMNSLLTKTVTWLPT